MSITNFRLWQLLSLFSRSNHPISQFTTSQNTQISLYPQLFSVILPDTIWLVHWGKLAGFETEEVKLFGLGEWNKGDGLILRKVVHRRLTKRKASFYDILILLLVKLEFSRRNKAVIAILKDKFEPNDDLETPSDINRNICYIR